MKKLFTLLSLSIALITGTANAQVSIFCEDFTGYDSTTANANYNGLALTYFGPFSYYTTVSSSGVAPNGYKFGVDSATMITPNIIGASQITFWMKGNGTNNSMGNSVFYVYESSDSVNWTLITSYAPPATTESNETLQLTAGTKYVKFFYDKDIGNVAFDDFCALGTVGVNELANRAAFTTFPNPSRGQVSVKMNGSRNGTLIVSNMLGNEIRRIAVRNEVEMSVDLSDLQDGIYFLKLKSDAGESSQRVVVRK